MMAMKMTVMKNDDDGDEKGWADRGMEFGDIV